MFDQFSFSFLIFFYPGSCFVFSVCKKEAIFNTVQNFLDLILYWLLTKLVREYTSFKTHWCPASNLINPVCQSTSGQRLTAKVMRVGSVTFLRPFHSKYLTKLAILYNYKHHRILWIASFHLCSIVIKYIGMIIEFCT